MRFTLRPLLFVLPLLAACSSGAGGTTSNPTTATEPFFPPAAAAPWSDDSTHLDVQCWGFMNGGMRFVADRNQMSAEQLGLLSSLRVIADDGECGEDGIDCEVDVTGGDGAVAKYLASANGSGCATRESMAAISYDQFTPFRQTLTCGYSKDTLNNEGVSAPVVPDSRCYDGLFTLESMDVPLANDTPGPRHVELAFCNGDNQAGNLTATVESPSGALVTLTPVAKANAGADGTCATIDTSFAEKGTYTLHIGLAEAFAPRGDMWLRYY